ncbi:hypothetical protein EH31_09205 [Erythrobacter longus]|uniref:site-specific DNA-methyltransferase (adenine-specific) n=1 Tax=Erythrobacter longus TaxID=1044 RepID=A0A074MXC1_ERYLO|nr:type ISP restriction/modification enzyme [Erythrobacter longus]KEO90257.1 hypothetical protein EH31_09205 [Erythrobacter longus]
MEIAEYLAEIKKLYDSGQTTEHSFRPALERLFKSIDPDLTVINEPRRTVDVGAPDFVFQRGDVSIGWCEAKDIGKDIRKFAKGDYSKEQKGRYAKGLPNLIYTNGLDFEFIRDGEAVDFITIADLIPTMPARTEAFPLLEARLAEFAQVTPLSVTSSKRLAELMAGKAALIKEIMGNALVSDLKAQGDGGQPTDLIGQYEAFKESLIHDITVAEFADIYAETIAYGLFAARLHDETLETFSRTEALELLPKSNPFLRALFVYIAGPNLDERLRRVVDDLCEVFRATDMEKVLRHFGKVTKRQDPFLHFYEDFLAEYNPKKRKARGVWYTPEPVVNFIVRAVDEVLKTEFGLSDGLADTSKISIDWDTGQTDKHGKPATIKKEVHRVQILDPATGTGTFLAEAIKLIAGRVQNIAPSQWSGYVENDLIPRIHGFELLMASYAMCHMKLDMILTGLGYKPSDKAPRLGVYLTNSLEEGERVEQTLFGLSRAIAEEAKAASDIKRQTPIMCVIGNPPYAVSSSNKSPFIDRLLADYKKDLNERNIQPLSDDYIKFIRYSQHLIEQNGEGVLGFITNNSYLDGLIHRQMRQSLLDTFDQIYVIDLHGSSKKKEVSPDGSPDQNVFDIMQGVAIIVAAKLNREKQMPATVRHLDVWGSRKAKNSSLFELEIDATDFAEIDTTAPNRYLVPKDFESATSYSNGVSLKGLFSKITSGIKTHKDHLVIDFERSALVARMQSYFDPAIGESEIRERLRLKDNKSWSVEASRKDNNFKDSNVKNVFYRPFDSRSLYYDSRIVERDRTAVMKHMMFGGNLGFGLNRQIEVKRGFHDIVVSDEVFDLHALSLKEGNHFAPLYLYPDEQDLDQSIRVNFDHKLYARIREAAGLTGPIKAPDTQAVESGAFRTATGDSRPDEVKVFDYIYGVLHCPQYRETYAEFLKIDFPRVPFPPSPEVFRTISGQGEALRRLHLMEDASIGDTAYRFDGEAPEGQDNEVEKPRFELQPDGTGRVYINGKGTEGQYFEGVPEVSWGFPIGGYQPAQKWLKDRKGRKLSFDDIRHYQKIIKILAETDGIMKGIQMPSIGDG